MMIMMMLKTTLFMMVVYTIGAMERHTNGYFADNGWLTANAAFY